MVDTLARSVSSQGINNVQHLQPVRDMIGISARISALQRGCSIQT